VLVHVPLFEILEAEVRAEEAGRSILQCNAPVTLDRRRPHPLIRRSICMIHNQQSYALDLGRCRESNYRLAATVRPNAILYPALLRGLAITFKGLEEPFVSLSLGIRSLLSLVENLSGVLGSANEDERCDKRNHNECPTRMPRQPNGSPFPVTH